MTPPEWRERDEQQLVPELKMTGSLQPFEKEFFRKDGSRVPVLIGVANFEEGGYQGVAFVLDLTERKRAADALRALQMELAHANRLATMGQLAASIAHEVNQPIGAARNNAHAALRFLAGDPPDLAEVREALECVVNETYRAGDIIGRIRDQVKKVPPRMEERRPERCHRRSDCTRARRAVEESRIGPDAARGGTVAGSRRSSSTAAGHAESDPQRDRGHDRRRR